MHAGGTDQSRSGNVTRSADQQVSEATRWKPPGAALPAYTPYGVYGFCRGHRHWRKVQANFEIAREALLKEQPDVLILIDYPSFNLRMAAFCKQHLPQTKIYLLYPAESMGMEAQTHPSHRPSMRRGVGYLSL